MPIIVIMLITTITGTIMWFVSKPLLVGLSIGLVLGVSLTLCVVRKLGRKAQRSILASELFHKITRYKACVYNIPLPETKTAVRATVYGKGHDYADLMDILKRQMKFPADISKEAATYALKMVGENPMEDKIKVALQYIDGGNNLTTGD